MRGSGCSRRPRICGGPSPVAKRRSFPNACRSMARRIPVRIACSSRPATSTPIASSAGWAGGPDYASEATALTNLLSKTKVSAIALTICSHSNVRGPRPIRDAPVKQRHCNLVHQRSSPKPLRCRTLQNDCDCRARHASQRHVKRGRDVGSPRGTAPLHVMPPAGDNERGFWESRVIAEMNDAKMGIPFTAP